MFSDLAVTYLTHQDNQHISPILAILCIRAPMYAIIHFELLVVNLVFFFIFKSFKTLCCVSGFSNFKSMCKMKGAGNVNNWVGLQTAWLIAHETGHS